MFLSSTQNFWNYKEYIDNNLRAFISNDKIGLENLNSGKKTFPCFDYIITSPHFIFVKVDDLWGLLDEDLSFIIPPKYSEIYPVEKVEMEAFITDCMNKRYDKDYIFNGDCERPTHIAIQSIETKIKRVKSHLLEKAFPFEYGIDEEEIEDSKAAIFKTTFDYDHLDTSVFIFVSNKIQQVVDLSINQTIYFGGEFLFIWHYKENSFINRNLDGTFGFLTCRCGRFFKDSFIGVRLNEKETKNITYSSTIHFYKNDFVSVCLPEIKKNNNGEIIYRKDWWALYRLGHIRTGLWNWAELDNSIESRFIAQTPFAFAEPFTQVLDGWGFICKALGKEWLVKYDKRFKLSEPELKVSDGDSEMTNVQLETSSLMIEDFQKQCFKGALQVASPCYEKIDVREDGLFDVCTEDGWGLYDKNFKQIVPPKYDSQIDWDNQLVLVKKNRLYGLINYQAEEIIPCKYEYVQVGKGPLNIWEWVMDEDYYEEKRIYNKIEINPDDEDLINEGYIIIGISLEKKVTTAQCDVFLPNGKYIASCIVSDQGSIEYLKENSTLVIKDLKDVFGNYKRYGYYVNKNTSPVLTSEELSNDKGYLSGNSSEGNIFMEKIIINKCVTNVEWNGLGRDSFNRFEVEEDNEVFCEHEGVLYTKKGYNRNGKINKNMVELVACPTNIKEHNIAPGTTRIANCAFKGSKIEQLTIPDTLKEIGVNAFYRVDQLKSLELPLSIDKIESQNVGMSGASSPEIIYNKQIFKNWDALYVYMLKHGFEKKRGNIVRIHN